MIPRRPAAFTATATSSGVRGVITVATVGAVRPHPCRVRVSLAGLVIGNQATDGVNDADSWASAVRPSTCATLPPVSAPPRAAPATGVRAERGGRRWLGLAALLYLAISLLLQQRALDDFAGSAIGRLSTDPTGFTW